MKRGLTIGTVMLMSLALTACGSSSSSSESASSSKKAKSEKVVSKSSSAKSSSKKASSSEKASDDANQILQAMNTDTLKKFNTELASGLKEDQGFAQAGKDGYNYATYIDTIEYNHARGLIVTVNDDFMNLTEDQGTVVGQGAQKLTAGQLLLFGSEVGADSTAVRTNIHYNGNRIGYSKAFNTSEFKWVK